MSLAGDLSKAGEGGAIGAVTAVTGHVAMP